MDRNTLIGTILIAIIMFVWLFWLAPPPQEPELTPDNPTEETQPVAPPQATTPELAERPPVVTDSLLAQAQQGEAETILVETDLYRAEFTTQGATLRSFLLREYTDFDQETPVQLIDPDSEGAMSMVFTTPNSHLVDTRTLFFTPSASDGFVDASTVARELAFSVNIGEGTLRYVYTFTPGSYEVGFRIEEDNAASFMTPEGYELSWNGAVPFSENPNTQDTELTHHGAYARSGTDVDGFTLASDEYMEATLRGNVSWIGVKNKYFAAVVIPDRLADAAELIGERVGTPEAGTVNEYFTASLLMPGPPAEVDAYRLYLGPLEFYRITAYDLGLYDMIDYGWDAFEWMTRPLAKFIFIPTFTFLAKFLPNYGLVIIVFAILLKLLLFPLTRSSYRSMARMRELQPKLEAIKEKYGDDPQKQQQAMMKMYKETGVNPLGGCMPMLLQYPIIIALWQYLQQAIQIRQQGFLWANDLSAPDVILNLPFTIPFYGDFVAGFTILMGVSMIVQMRIQQGSAATSNPQMKMFMYIMPLFIFVIFNRFPSGLSLYYLIYNIVTAVQQKFINRSLEKEQADDASSNGKSRFGNNASKGKRADRKARKAGVK